VGILNPVVRFLGPYQTVCNYWNYQWTYLGEHLSAKDPTGTAQRVLANSAPPQNNSLATQGAYEPANATRKTAASEGYPTFDLFPGLPPPLPPLPLFFPEIAEDELREVLGDPAVLHGQPYGGAIDNQGNADCETGQRGYPRNRMALKIPDRDSSRTVDPVPLTPPVSFFLPDPPVREFGGNRFQVVSDPHTPGNQGSTYRGRPDVPDGETFSREPEWPPASELPPALSTGTYGGW
jgi:phospholipid/cholesterol/gamma-HCH transport system substrate-binding protein